MAKSNVRPAGDIKQLSPTLFHKLEVTLRSDGVILLTQEKMMVSCLTIIPHAKLSYVTKKPLYLALANS